MINNIKWFFIDIWQNGWKGLWLFNWLPNEPGLRYFGFRKDYYDGNIYSFGFWYFNVGSMLNDKSK